MKNLILYLAKFILISLLLSCGLPDPAFKSEKPESFEINEEAEISEDILELQNYVDSLVEEEVDDDELLILLQVKKEEIDSRSIEESSSSKILISSSSSSSSKLISSSSSVISSSSEIPLSFVNSVDIRNSQFVMAPGTYRVVFTNHDDGTFNGWTNILCQSNLGQTSIEFEAISYESWLVSLELPKDKTSIAEFTVFDNETTCFSIVSSKGSIVVLK